LKIGVASGKPTKSFFVKMITRDISLQDCILDLIDNSIDGAWEQEGSRPVGLDLKADLSKYQIDIVLKEKEFSIKDNCGGITLVEAEKYAFTFGRDDANPISAEEQQEDFSIGVYGIGLKRASFKLGRSIVVKSTYPLQGKLEAFAVPINVSEWIEKEEWDFPIASANPSKTPGVEITITDLNQGSASAFANSAFEHRLRKVISRDYALHFQYGLRVNLNGTPVKGWDITFLGSDAFAPYRNLINPEGVPDGVRVEVVCGMAAPPPDETDPASRLDDDDRFGWYVACNGRFVLSADKTDVSGWGTDGWPNWHNQYNGFLGLVFFSSKDTELLPVTTTKRSIDTTSAAFRAVQPAMRELTKQWTSYTNLRKGELDKAKKLEEEARPVKVSSLPKSVSMNLPKIVKRTVVKQRVANILYSVDIGRALEMGEALGNRMMPYKHIGEKTFEYAYKKLIGGK
jgi:Histidine kinase-, DNA gyrase B-, and HSP90-like ATPase